MSQIIKTSLQCCLSYKGYGFAWFYDSNLAMQVANNLASAGLLGSITTYQNFCLDDMNIGTLWQFLQIGCSALYIQYHRSYKVSEVHEIGHIIQQTIKDYNNEKGYNRIDK